MTTQWYQIKDYDTTLCDVLTIQQELILCSAGSDEPHESLPRGAAPKLKSIMALVLTGTLRLVL